MSYKITNSLGAINISNEVVARIAGLAAMECYGVVGMAAKNVRDGIVHLLKIENLTRGIKLSSQDDIVNIDLRIVVRYGTNISAICESLKSTVKYKVEEACGLSIGQINVFVEGLRVDG